MKNTLFLTALTAATAAATLPAAAQHWHQPLNAGLPAFSPSTRYEDVYFTSYSTGFAVDLAGHLYKTTDAGSHWRQVNDTLATGTPGFRAIEFLGDGQTGLAGSLDAPGVLLRTTDGGETWTDISANVPDQNLSPVLNNDDRRRICGLAHLGNTFYGVGWWGASRARLFKSTDKGLSWTSKVIDSSLASCLVDVTFLSADTGFATGGKMGGGTTFSPAEAVILRTTDGGATWTKVFSDTYIGGRIWKIQFLDHRNGVGSIEPYFSDTAAMVRTTDGGASWQIIGTGYTPFSSFYGTQGIGFVTPEQGWIGGYYNGIFQTGDAGAHWQYLPFGYNLNRFFVLDSKHVYAGGATIYRWGDSTNFSVSVPQLPSVLPHRLQPIAPNPAQGVVRIVFDLSTTTNVALRIVASDTRQTLQLENRRLPAGHYEYSWDGRSSPPGNYAVWLGTDEIPMVQKFVLRQ